MVLTLTPYLSLPLVPEIIQHEAAMNFEDEVGHVVYKSVAEDFIYGSVDGAEPGLWGEVRRPRVIYRA